MKLAILVTFSFILMCVMHEIDAQRKFGARKQMQTKGKYKKVIGTKPITTSSSRSRGSPKTTVRTNKVTRTRPVHRVAPVHSIAPVKPEKPVEPVQHVDPDEHDAPIQRVPPVSKIIAVANAVVATAPIASQVVGAVLQSRSNGNYLGMQPQMQNQFSQYSTDSLQNSPQVPPENFPEDPPQDLPQDPPQDVPQDPPQDQPLDSEQDPPHDLPQESQDS